MKIASINNKSIMTARIHQIQDGNSHEREAMIEEYIPFIVKTTSKFINGYVDLKNSDEFSVALMAFNEAIDKYQEGKGSFIHFASLVMNNRLKDYKASVKKHEESISLDIDHEIIADDDFTRRLDIKHEIELFIDKLMTFGITIDELVEASPKHQKTRVRSVEMARYIIDIEELKANFYRLKRLPVLLLSQVFDIAKKTIKRTRKFTIATTIVLDSELEEIKSRVLLIEGSEQDV